jgi:hypothetical protein
VESFSGAWDAIMRYARNYGALHLPEHQLEELEDWVTVHLGEAIFAAEETSAWSDWIENNHIGPGARL